MGYSPWGRKELDTTEHRMFCWLTRHTHWIGVYSNVKGKLDPRGRVLAAKLLMN